MNFSFHWFDLIVVVVLFLGILRGRKHGMSIEFMLLLQWLTTLMVATFGYKPLGQFILQMSGISRLWSYLVSYVTCVIIVSMIFAIISRSTGGKLVGSDAFGSGEYYLGMAAGAVRFLCVLLIITAMLNARLYAPQEIAAKEKAREYNYGSIRFPTLDTIQPAIFKKSLVGRLLNDHARFLLIEPSAPEQRQFKQKEFDAR